MNCPSCNNQIHWENDFNYEDYGRDGEGAVLVYSCHNEQCDIDLIEMYTKIDDAF
jgi:hypothetical protein